MEIPKVILSVGDTVEYEKPMNSHWPDSLYGGIIVAVNIDNCSHKRTLRDLSYDIEDNTDGRIYKVSHESIFETILCEHCEADILDYGVEEKVWKIHRYNRDSNSSYNEFCNSLNKNYMCSCCGETISDKAYSKLSKYLNI